MSRLKITLICIFPWSAIMAADNTSDLIVNVSGFQGNEGMAMIALLNSKESYSAGKNGAPPFRNEAAKISNQKVQVVFQAIPFGNYAVKIFHDANNSGDLDTNFLGIPKEAYGFSNNARGKMGPPSYDAARFAVNQKIQNINITVK